MALILKKQLEHEVNNPLVKHTDKVWHGTSPNVIFAFYTNASGALVNRRDYFLPVDFCVKPIHRGNSYGVSVAFAQRNASLKYTMRGLGSSIQQEPSR